MINSVLLSFPCFCCSLLWECPSQIDVTTPFLFTLIHLQRTVTDLGNNFALSLESVFTRWIKSQVSSFIPFSYKIWLFLLLRCFTICQLKILCHFFWEYIRHPHRHHLAELGNIEVSFWLGFNQYHGYSHNRGYSVIVICRAFLFVYFKRQYNIAHWSLRFTIIFTIVTFFFPLKCKFTCDSESRVPSCAHCTFSNYILVI